MLTVFAAPRSAAMVVAGFWRGAKRESVVNQLVEAGR
jgi:hypothetical protein